MEMECGKDKRTKKMILRMVLKGKSILNKKMTSLLLLLLNGTFHYSDVSIVDTFPYFLLNIDIFGRDSVTK